MADKNKGKGNGKGDNRKVTDISKITEDDQNLDEGVSGFWKALGGKPKGDQGGKSGGKK